MMNTMFALINRLKPLSPVLVLIVFFLTGCTVLTKSQTKAVQKFAHSADIYTQLPGDVIQKYAEIRKAGKLMAAHTLSDADASARIIEDALRIERQLSKRADRADRAIKIISDYSKILIALTADTFTGDLQSAAENLGENLNDAVDTYNQKFNSQIPDIGGFVAGAVRAIGGVYIKREQSIILKETVGKSQPLIDEMTKSIIDLLNTFIHPDIDLIGNAKADLTEAYKRAPPPRSLYMIETYANELDAAEKLARLAQKSKKAAQTLQRAHQNLVENLEEKTDLKSSIEQIETLRKEVETAQKLVKKLK
jgi:DNA repair exonuclease SbcCD ATPase subunit